MGQTILGLRSKSEAGWAGDWEVGVEVGGRGRMGRGEGGRRVVTMAERVREVKFTLLSLCKLTQTDPRGFRQ